MVTQVGSVYLVIATWAFLVLPTCPCQLLIAFGVDVHGELHRPAGVLLDLAAGGSPLGECHCEDEVLRSAEVVDPFLDAEVPWSDADSSLISFEFILSSPRLAQLGETIVHPPPLDGRSWLSESERLCVYRL